MIISDKIIYASQFAEYYTGKYFTRCDTFDEVQKILSQNCIYIKRGVPLTKIHELDKDKPYIIVQFSLEENYTKYEYVVMFVQKKYLSRFMKNMKADEALSVQIGGDE